MSQSKISRRSFLRGAGATATIAAASCMAPSAAACDIKSLWSMDLQILATSDTHGKFDPWDYAANKADASGSVAQQATASSAAPGTRWWWMQAIPFRPTPQSCS